MQNLWNSFEQKLGSFVGRTVQDLKSDLLVWSLDQLARLKNRLAKSGVDPSRSEEVEIS